MTLEDYKIKSGLSYTDLQKKTGLCRTTLNKAVTKPWRTKIETFLMIANIVNMPEEAAEKEWKISKREFNLEKYK